MGQTREIQRVFRVLGEKVLFYVQAINLSTELPLAHIFAKYKQVPGSRKRTLYKLKPLTMVTLSSNEPCR